MNNMNSAFDLFFDIKTEEELKREYLSTKRDLELMEELMDRYDIDYKSWKEYII